VNNPEQRPPVKRAEKPGRPGRRTGTAGKPAAGAARRRSREYALQGLYEWLISGTEAAAIDSHMREDEAFGKCDSTHFDALLHGCIDQASALDEVLGRHVDRPTQELSPIEHAALMIGAYELMHCIDIPYRVVINEGVELAKSFGGTDGHRYVNGVLDKAALDLRQVEVQAWRASRAAS
jgi:transcription antitermination protein NusB